MKKHIKSADGFYHIKGKKYSFLRGARRQVWAGTAYMTEGGLTRDKLHYNKRGRIVSKKNLTQQKKKNVFSNMDILLKKVNLDMLKKKQNQDLNQNHQKQKEKDKCIINNIFFNKKYYFF